MRQYENRIITTRIVEPVADCSLKNYKPVAKLVKIVSYLVNLEVNTIPAFGLK
jgi:hypothetical protein